MKIMRLHVFSQKLRSLPLQIKLTVIFILLGLIPMMLLNVWIVARQISREMEQMSVNAANHSHQIANSVDTYLSDIDRITKAPLYDEDVQAILEDITLNGKLDLLNNTDVIVKMKDFLFSATIMEEYINAIAILSLDGDVLFKRTPTGQLTEKALFYNAIEQMKDTDSVIIPLHTQKSLYSRQEKQVVTLIRRILNVKKYRTIGYIAVDVDIKSFEELIMKQTSKWLPSIVITTNNGELLYTNENNISDISIYTASIESKNNQLTSNINGANYLISKTTCELLDIVVYANIQQDVYTHAIYTDYRVYISLMIILFIVVIIAVNIVSKKLTRPLRHLVQTMDIIQTGDFSVRAEVESLDEAGHIASDFNDMLVYIDKLIHQGYESELRRRDAQIEALQSQINPHFLYNTLESIAMMAEINDDIQTAEMIADLGKMFRYSAKSSSAMVTVKREVENVINYISIQNVRYSGNIHLQIDINEDLMDVQMLKLTLQPLVENAILHGLKNGKREMTIKIHAMEESDVLYISVEDNGCGMSEKELTVLKHNIKKETSRKLVNSVTSIGNNTSTGLRNVNQRIRLHFGDAYGINVESQLGVGTKVLLTQLVKGLTNEV